jgi:hypothetical protein
MGYQVGENVGKPKLSALPSCCTSYLPLCIRLSSTITSRWSQISGIYTEFTIQPFILIHDLKQQYAILIVTYNMQQASRVSDMTAFFNAKAAENGKRFGYLVEYNETSRIFNSPQEEDTRNYVSGRFGQV